MAQYSLFEMKVPLNTNKTDKYIRNKCKCSILTRRYQVNNKVAVDCHFECLYLT